MHRSTINFSTDWIFGFKADFKKKKLTDTGLCWFLGTSENNVFRLDIWIWINAEININQLLVQRYSHT